MQAVDQINGAIGYSHNRSECLSAQHSQPLQARLYIDGEWRSGETYDVRHPQSSKVVSTAVAATPQDCVAAVEAAGRALPSWESLPPTERRRVLQKATDLLDTETYKKRIAEAVCLETGALDYWGFVNSFLPPIYMREAAALATQIKGETVASATPGVTFTVHRKAIGVILAIAPWNAPGPLTVRAIAVPLICGNTIVLKSSEVCPFTQSIIVEALHEAGIPKGVLNFINMSVDTVPKLTADLIAHPLIRKINFTGSDRVGKILAMEAAKYLKPCVLELGGKAPCVVLDDANVKDAARAIVSGAMVHSGQVCMSTERVIVQRGVSQALIEEVKAVVSRLPPLGPVFSKKHAGEITELLMDAKDQGADVLIGDTTHDTALLKPHILLNIKPGMRAWERESFGPVVGFAVVDTVDEAITLANTTEYSLTASIWTSNINGQELALRIRAGCVVINGSTFVPEITIGVYGLGGATGYGRFDIEHFTDPRTTCIRPPNEQYPLVDPF